MTISNIEVKLVQQATAKHVSSLLSEFHFLLRNNKFKMKKLSPGKLTQLIPAGFTRANTNSTKCIHLHGKSIVISSTGDFDR